MIWSDFWARVSAAAAWRLNVGALVKLETLSTRRLHFVLALDLHPHCLSNALYHLTTHTHYIPKLKTVYQTLKHFEIVSLYTFGPYEHCFQLRAYLWFMLKECQPAFFSHHVEWKFQTRNCFNILLTIVKNASQCNLTFGVEHMINYSFFSQW